MKKNTEDTPQLKSVQGVCKFCGQFVALEVPESFTDIDIAEEAVKKCDCPEARAYTKQQEDIATAEGMIKEFFKDREGMDTIKDILLSAVKPLAKSEIGALSVSKDGYTGSMKPTKDGIKVTLKYTTVDSVES